MSEAAPFRTRPPTGKPPWPMLLIAGVEKCGKSYGGALFSSSDLIDRTFWIEIGEGAADQYGSIPGARYEIVEHDGTYQAIGRAIWLATQQPRNGRPHAIVIDSITELWDLLADEAQVKANRRAAAKAAEKKQAAPTDDVQITMDLWNEAKKRWRKILEILRTYDGPVILMARLELVTVMTSAGKPTTEREWKIRAEKNLPFEADAIVKMVAPQTAALTGVRSTVLQVPPGKDLPLPNFTIDELLRRMGLDAVGATSPREYIAPRVDMAELAAEPPAERRMERQPRNAGPQDDEWTNPAPTVDVPHQLPPPVPGVPRANGPQLTKIRILMLQKRGLGRDREAVLRAVSAMVRRPLETSKDLSSAEASSIIETLSMEPDLADASLPPSDEGIDVVQALEQLIADAHDEDSFELAKADVAREFEAGSIGDYQLVKLQARWVGARSRAMAGAA